MTPEGSVVCVTWGELACEFVTAGQGPMNRGEEWD